uniref:Growth hormone regulated TBC protein 1a n=1 Tax=Oryzias melastigma TaxID=30732 RepID=A0A3B3DPN8_ORYME
MEKSKPTNGTQVLAASRAKDRVDRLDPYGFERSVDFDYASYEELMSEYLVVLTRRSIKWSKLLKGKGKVQKNVKLKRYVRKGIPNEHRALIWMAASGAQDQLEKNPGYYQSMLEAQHDPKLVETIKTDYYTPAMLGLKADQEVLGELVKVKIPRVWQVMSDHNVMWTLVVSRWFICLYIDILPVETVLRIWDCLFYEGSKILFRVALTLIHHNQALIEKAQSLPDVCQAFKESVRGPLVDECHTFMQKIFNEPGTLSMATLTKLRTTCRARIVAEES